MNVWDFLTWAAIAILGPGALVIVAVFLRGLRAGRDRGQSGEPEGPS